MQNIMPTDTPEHLTISTFSPDEISAMELICGTSGRAVQLAIAGFGGLFAAVIYFVVLSHPNVSDTVKYIVTGLFGVAILSLLVSGRLRIGWPTIITDEDYLYVIFDPMKSEFFKIPISMVKQVEKRMLYPNTMAVSVLLDETMLNEDDTQLLRNGVFPAEDRIHVQTAFNSRSRVVNRIKALCGIAGKASKMTTSDGDNQSE
ncbi:hypothetical protein QTP81_14280 [Alteromonas sp. ASW11-36]|uniref:PrgI family protein n=1 Tax=Alteromonas arenosi TaxID=3055817 RepID=A0ABT7T014_9ALTE|nr:hypothetical protein [Alteromonas sp. ASW11-36]MDM7861766.1 hypothetical protein [Alteromonas sp. ASW11-36]